MGMVKIYGHTLNPKTATSQVNSELWLGGSEEVVGCSLVCRELPPQLRQTMKLIWLTLEHTLEDDLSTLIHKLSNIKLL